MPRKNSRAAQPKLRMRNGGTAGRRQKDTFDVNGDIVPKWKLKAIIKPDGYCTLPSGRRKVAFNTEEKASRALANAKHNRSIQGLEHVEDRIYDTCQGTGPGIDIKHYHLTSIKAIPIEEVTTSDEA